MTDKNRLALTDTVMSALIKISEGNPGGCRVVADCIKLTPIIDPDSALSSLSLILDFDSLGIYGSRIWMLYKDVCGEDYVNLHAVLRAWQLGFLPEADLNSAIDGRLKLDVPSLLAQVKKQLPRFGNTEKPKEEEPMQSHASFMAELSRGKS